MKDQEIRPARGLVLAAFFALVFGGAMVIGPLIFFTLQPVFPIPFHRAMDRALLMTALAVLVLFRHRLWLRQWWPVDRGATLQLGLGYLAAVISVQAAFGFNLAGIGFHSSHPSASQLGQLAVMAAVASLIVPPLEETLFRGFVLTELSGLMRPRWACAVGAAIFMLAHFLKVPNALDAEPIRWWSGAQAVFLAFVPVLHGEFLGGRGLNLFLIGLILGGVFLKTGRLWLNAGLHSGWILALLLMSGLTRPNDPPALSFLRGDDLLSSPLTSLVLIGLAAWLWRYYPPPSDAPESGENAP